MKRRTRKSRYGISSRLIRLMVPVQWDKALMVMAIVTFIGLGAVSIYAMTHTESVLAPTPAPLYVP
jgi:hypothetical protein